MTDPHDLVVAPDSGLLRRIPWCTICAEIDKTERTRRSSLVYSLEPDLRAVLTNAFDFREVEILDTERCDSDGPEFRMNILVSEVPTRG